MTSEVLNALSRALADGDAMALVAVIKTQFPAPVRP